jgi:hypothetical protein
MSEEEIKQAADEKNDDPGTDPGSDTKDSSAEPTEDTSVDLSDFEREVAEADRAVVSKAEYERLRRLAGQVPSLQRDLAEVRKGTPKDSVSREEYDALMEAVADLLPEDRKSALDARRASRETTTAVAEQFTDFEKRIFDKLGIKDDDPDAATKVDANDPDVLQERLNTAWDKASDVVRRAATEAGVELAAEDFAKAQEKAGAYNPKGAVELLLGDIKSRAKGGSKTERVAEKKNAASGGDTRGVDRDGSGGNHDMSTLAGLAQARRAGAIDSDKFVELYRKINREAGR